MAGSRFADVCEPAALRFLQDRHDPSTIAALKVEVLTRRMQEALTEWQRDLADPKCKFPDLAARMVRNLQAKLEIDQEGAAQ